MPFSCSTSEHKKFFLQAHNKMEQLCEPLHVFKVFLIFYFAMYFLLPVFPILLRAVFALYVYRNPLFRLRNHHLYFSFS